MTERVIALIVTHNRLNYLKRCLSYIENQDRDVEQILVINNASTDGTSDFLKTKKNIISINQENLGSAGGWHTGIQYSVKNNFDFIWMMDDDGFPDIKSLKFLTSHITNKHSCISSVVINEEDKNLLVFPMPKVNQNGNPIIFSLFRKYKKLSTLNKNFLKVYPYAHLFNGSLIRVESIKKIGNINKDFILYGDEVDYFYRLKKIGKVESDLSAYHYHPDISKRKISKQNAYYYLRNSIFLNFKYFNNAYLRSLLNFFILILRMIYRNGFFVTMFLLLSIKKNIFISSFFDAWFNRLGKIEK